MIKIIISGKLYNMFLYSIIFQKFFCLYIFKNAKRLYLTLDIKGF